MQALLQSVQVRAGTLQAACRRGRNQADGTGCQAAPGAGQAPAQCLGEAPIQFVQTLGALLQARGGVQQGQVAQDGSQAWSADSISRRC